MFGDTSAVYVSHRTIKSGRKHHSGIIRTDVVIIIVIFTGKKRLKSWSCDFTVASVAPQCFISELQLLRFAYCFFILFAILRWFFHHLFGFTLKCLWLLCDCTNAEKHVHLSVCWPLRTDTVSVSSPSALLAYLYWWQAAAGKHTEQQWTVYLWWPWLILWVSATNKLHTV